MALNFFVQRLSEQSKQIDKIVRDNQVYAHVEADNAEWIKQKSEGGINIISTFDLLNPQRVNDIKVLIMQESDSLTNFNEIYGGWDLIEFYELLTIRMAVKANKEVKQKEIKVASIGNLKNGR